MKFFITGNLGYIGPVLSKEIVNQFHTPEIIGYDIGYFFDGPMDPNKLTQHITTQHVGDVRDFDQSLLNGVDTVIYLAAISNDPIGNEFESATMEINCNSAYDVALKAKNAGVKSFVYASSCSVYGSAEDAARTENSSLDPLTAYAKSKVRAEERLETLSNHDFIITCHRFATACGWSNNLRLDLVLNDFVAGALTSGEINILSDGTPWRPLIHVQDMARAMIWSSNRSIKAGGEFLIVNSGSTHWNLQIKDLAYAVSDQIENTRVTINQNASPDKRSYRVDFSLFERLAPEHQPKHNLNTTISGLIDGLKSIDFSISNFRESDFIRLNVIRKKIQAGKINEDLFEAV